jgi:membrane protease YdiL (CAAX protease family)
MPKFSFRGFVSLLLSLSFLLIVISGLVLWLAPPGPGVIAGMSKGAWKHLHIIIALVMLFSGVVHLYLNWATYWSYLWNRSARRPNMIWELTLTLAIVALIVGSSHWNHPPGEFGPPGGPHGPHGMQQQNPHAGTPHD